VAELNAGGRPVLHLGIHTFTAVLAGKVRELEMGILYDPARREEKAFALRWRDTLRLHVPEGETGIRIRFNQPYRGVSDSLPTWLRKRFPAEAYRGVEVEVNQGLIRQDRHRWNALRSAILQTLVEMMPPLSSR
jgi:predicted N-formylglutamate amidohydrolase